MPALVPALLDEVGIAGAARSALLHALDRKDAAAVAEHAGSLAEILTELLLAAGAADQALAVLGRVALSPEALRLARRLAASVSAVRARAPGLKLTVDPVEFRGFRYHTGVSVSAYSEGSAHELGRGGRYLSGAKSEPATGITLFPEAVAGVAPGASRKQRLFVPQGQLGADSLRTAGFATVAQLEPVADLEAEARRLLCSHILRGGVAVALPTQQTESK
jgi:ATP phosphoribosyltransferase regulatory subunit